MKEIAESLGRALGVIFVILSVVIVNLLLLAAAVATAKLAWNMF